MQDGYNPSKKTAVLTSFVKKYVYKKATVNYLWNYGIGSIL